MSDFWAFLTRPNTSGFQYGRLRQGTIALDSPCVLDEAEQEAIATGALPRSQWWHGMWWNLRGVRVKKDLARLCERCGRRGVGHFQWNGCIRYKVRRHKRTRYMIGA